MKTGFKLLIQKDIIDSDKIVCKKFLDNFIDKTLKDPKKRYFGVVGGGYTSGLWRGRYGIEINFYCEYREISKTIVFRRVLKNARHFACVYADTLEVKNDSYLDKCHDEYRDIVPDGEVPKMCLCARHKGSIKVDWKKDKKPEFETYFEHGEDRG